MKEIKTGALLKILVIFSLLVGFGVSARVIYKNLNRAFRVNPEKVEFYRPYLDKDLVKNAADLLRKKSAP